MTGKECDMIDVFVKLEMGKERKKVSCGNVLLVEGKAFMVVHAFFHFFFFFLFWKVAHCPQLLIKLCSPA